MRGEGTRLLSVEEQFAWKLMGNRKARNTGGDADVEDSKSGADNAEGLCVYSV